MPDPARVLVVDDHADMADLLADQLRDHGYVVETATSGAAAIDAARRELPDVVITDLRMHKVDGFDVLDGVHRIDPGLPVLIMTAFGAIDSAVEAMRRGAWHYVSKPFRLDEVLVHVNRAVEHRRLTAENRALRGLGPGGPLAALVGASAPMRLLRDTIARVAPLDAPVLVLGESGTGKELVARALHQLSPRRDAAFVPVNCTAIPATLLESELFGHVKGAFTGASQARKGLFVEADGGTLFLDEIGDMPLELQARLLRVLEDGMVRAVGADATRSVNVRVVAATHQPLPQRVQEGRFRADLLYRLDVVRLVTPPLRDRPDDVPILVEHFLKRAREAWPSARVRAFSPELVTGLAARGWPGNVRELENVVRRIVATCPDEVAGASELGDTEASPLERAKRDVVPLRDLQEEYIGWVLARCGGNKTRAAELLGIDVSTLHRRERGAKGG